ncbi:LysR family transcriptional regulator [Salinicola endophyticus]|uniref:LysR family transcriptional regulator n=1 Tax=Salinicola endophyticus TaxID=1949083 RepID=A0ABY8FJV4_9GAMM|nr:LysR family transcriptional regulator [Salinicola endophyticus]WFF42330.1 LysR family transcriptional regulator [Salinicola endophyticus]
MHFDLADLRIFVHVAEARSLTAGASRAHLSTAAVSGRIKTLEQQLDSRLFYRSAQGVELTPAGERLLRHARLILRQVERVKSDFSAYADGASGHLRIFANTTAVIEFMPEVLAEFLATRPGVTVDLQERMTSDIIRGVLDGTADMGILGIMVGMEVPPRLRSLPFSRDRLVLATPWEHPLATREAVTFEDALDFPHVGLHEGSTLFHFLQVKALELGLPLPVRIQVFGFESACRMIEAGVGVGIIPESCALRYQASMKLQVRHLGDAWAYRERTLLIRDEGVLPGCAQELLDTILSGEMGPLGAPPASLS